MSDDLMDKQMVSCRVDRRTLKLVESLGSTRSEGCRALLDLGAAAMGDPATIRQRLELHALTAELRELAKSLPAGTTSSGAIWAHCPEALPADPPPQAVIATPVGVLLLAADQCFSIDVEAGRIAFEAADHPDVTAEIDVPALVELGALLLPAVVGVGRNGGARKLPSGVVIGCTVTGDIAIGMGEMAMAVSPVVAFQWVAEVVALLSRSITSGVQVRAALNRQIEEVSSWQ